MIGCVVETGQFCLVSVLLNVLLVCEISLFDAAVVSNVLALRIDSVQFEINVWFSEVAILINDTLRLFQVSDFSVFLPPINEVAVRVKLTTLIVEA